MLKRFLICVGSLGFTVIYPRYILQCPDLLRPMCAMMSRPSFVVYGVKRTSSKERVNRRAKR